MQVQGRLAALAFCAAGIVVPSLVVPSLSAQIPCVPFAKFGLTEVTNWQAGKSFTLGQTDSGGRAISLTFDHDGPNGVVLSKIGHRGTHLDGRVTHFDYTTVPPPGLSRQLWKAVLRPLDSNIPAEINPGDATEFRLWLGSSPLADRAVFRWDGCCVPNPASKSFFWFEIQVLISPLLPNRASWSARMARFENPLGNAPFTIDEVHAPIVYAQQPGNSQLARILVPAAQRLPLPSTNLSMRSWQLFGLSATLEHPAREQQMQFSALYAGDPTELQVGTELYSAHRKILYCSTEDTEGHFKNFKHDIASDANGVAYYRWCPVYYPAYGPTPRLNCFSSPYPAVLCALQAQSDAYWYDVCEHYRQFVRWRMGLTPIRSPLYRLNPDAVGESVIVATSTFGGIKSDHGDVFSTFVEMGRHHQAVFKNPGTGKASPLFMEWQKWLKARPTDLEDPIGPGYNPVPFTMAESAPQEPSETARDEIARARSLGMNVSVYTIPLLIDRDDWLSFDADWLLHDRMGHPIPDLGLGAFLTDLGNEAVPDWFANTMYRDIMDGTPDLGGIYMDTLGGSGSFLRYPAPGSPFFNFKYHGGTKYIEGGRRLLDMVRHQVGKNKQPHRHPDIPFVATEGVQEFYTGKYDAAQHGLKPLPLQTQLSVFIDQLTSPGLPPAPVEAQTGNPPLWNLVYHEYSRAEALGMMLSTRGVSALLGGGQPVDFNSGKVGLTWEEWGNYNRLVHALMFIQGMKPTLFSYFYDFRDLSLLVENNGTVEVRDPSVPQQVQMLEFMQRMHESISRSWEAGQYLNHGAMERPLALPTLKLTATGFEPGEVTTTRNPAIPTFERNDQLLGVTKHFYEDPFTQALIYPVANVLHSVWRASPLSSRLGLVFVNWSDQPAAWRGTFDPRLYDFFQSRFRVTGVAPAGGGVSTYPVGLGDGTTLLSWNTAGDGLKLQHHSQSSPGLMPPRSVQVFWIDPLW